MGENARMSPMPWLETPLHFARRAHCTQSDILRLLEKRAKRRAQATSSCLQRAMCCSWSVMSGMERQHPAKKKEKHNNKHTHRNANPTAKTKNIGRTITARKKRQKKRERSFIKHSFPHETSPGDQAPQGAPILDSTEKSDQVSLGERIRIGMLQGRAMRTPPRMDRGAPWALVNPIHRVDTT